MREWNFLSTMMITNEEKEEEKLLNMNTLFFSHSMRFSPFLINSNFSRCKRIFPSLFMLHNWHRLANSTSQVKREQKCVKFENLWSNNYHFGSCSPIICLSLSLFPTLWHLWRSLFCFVWQIKKNVSCQIPF